MLIRPHLKSLLFFILIGSLCGALFLLTSLRIPHFYKHRQTALQHQHFIHYFWPFIQSVNHSVSALRHRVVLLHARFQKGQPILPADKFWLHHVAQQYQLPTLSFSHEEGWSALLWRVDVVPASLLLARAINMSDWGTSHSALKALNFLGQLCHSKGCGVPVNPGDKSHLFIPKQLAVHPVYDELKTFSNVLASVQYEILLFNTHNDYVVFRKLRSQMRQAHHPLLGIDVLPGLRKSALWQTTQLQIVRKLILDYGLQRFDTPHLSAPPASEKTGSILL